MSLQFRKTLRSPEHDKFVALIREARKKAGLTQAEAAEALGIRQSFISDIERGERRVDVIEFLQLCKIYQCDPARLVKKL